jgi:hypothetical protein
LLFWRKDFAVTSMNDLCDVLSVRSPDLYAAFGSKSGAPSRSRAQLQTIGPPIWGNFEGVTLAPALKTACGAKRSFERGPKRFRRFPDALKIVSVEKRRRQLIAPPYSLPVLCRMPAGLRFRGRSLRAIWLDLRALA